LLNLVVLFELIFNQPSSAVQHFIQTVLESLVDLTLLNLLLFGLVSIVPYIM
jgi:hypothetical protein